jgi:acetyltransferase-like isoleucine patch superfamily enzyme
MGRNSRIRPFTMCKGLELLQMGESSSIGRFNLITGFPLSGDQRHFAANKERIPQLIMGDHAAITSQHIIDCTDSVSIGSFATVGGFRSQILTHAVDLVHNRQDCKPVTIGDYCFVGTAATILPGSALPNRSILGAQSLLTKQLDSEGYLYAGVPAVLVKPCADGAYFSRSKGYVW